MGHQSSKSKNRSENVYCGDKHTEYSKCMFLLHTFWDTYDNEPDKVSKRWREMLLNERKSEETKEINDCRILTKNYISEIEICAKDGVFERVQKSVLKDRIDDYTKIVPVFTNGFQTYKKEKFKGSMNSE